MLMKHASQRCDRILILSGKHGLISPDAKISWYDSWINTLPPDEYLQLTDRVSHQLQALSEPVAVLCYLPKAYYGLLEDAGIPSTWTIHRPYASVAFTAFKKTFANEIKNYGVLPARR